MVSWDAMVTDERYVMDTQKRKYDEIEVVSVQVQGNACEVRHKDTPQERVIYYQQDRMAAGCSRGHLSDVVLKEAFARTAEATKECVDGSTGTAVALSRDGIMHVANLADSPAMLFVVGKDHKVHAHYLVHDEHDAIPKISIQHDLLPTHVDYAEVSKVHYPISIARNFGGKPYGLPKVPDIQSFDMAHFIKEGDRAFVCVASDGIAPPDKQYSTCKEWMTHYASVLEGVLAKNTRAGTQEMAEAIVAEAVAQRRTPTKDGKAGEQDNISLMLAEIPQTLKRDFFMAVCDGHRASALDGSDQMHGDCADMAAHVLHNALQHPKQAFMQMSRQQSGSFRT